jgi:beta-mannosidase
VQENLNVQFNSLEWRDRVYLSQISQAIALKTETEVYRSGKGNFMNTMGALYWQLNDVWMAPSWSSIEYNGNFKIVHYWMKNVFAPQTIITQINMMRQLVIYALSDEVNVETKPMVIKMNIFTWNSFKVVDSVEWKFDMKANHVTHVDNFDLFNFLHTKNYDVYEVFLMFYMSENNDGNSTVNALLSTNFIFPGNYKNIKLIRDPNLTVTITKKFCEYNQSQISILSSIDSPAIFVYLALEHEFIEHYQFSNNGFIQVEPVKILQLNFENPDCMWEISESQLKVKTLNEYMLR